MTAEMLLRPWRRPPVKVSCPVVRRLDVSGTWYATNAPRDWASPESASAVGILRSGVKHEGAAAEPVRTESGSVKQPAGWWLAFSAATAASVPLGSAARGPRWCLAAAIGRRYGRRWDGGGPRWPVGGGTRRHEAALPARGGHQSQPYNGLTGGEAGRRWTRWGVGRRWLSHLRRPDRRW